MDKVLKNFVGIDISKPFFDVALLREERPGDIAHRQFPQSAKGFGEMAAWLGERGAGTDGGTLFCMEHTGIYGSALAAFLCGRKAQLWVEMGLRIKRASGLERGSNDRTDAKKIARYAYRFRDQKKLWTPSDDNLERIGLLVSQRDRVVDTISRLTVPVNELASVGQPGAAAELSALQEAAMGELEKTRANIEEAIAELVGKDRSVMERVERVQSIKGIGRVTAVALLVCTNGFASFRTAKELACYCGVAPFVRKQSGTSVRSRPGVSPLANKKLKWLLHMCALSAIKFDRDLKAYYERKVLEGKNKMAVINAVRNKLVLRIFAVLRDNRDFVDNYKRKCA